MKVLERLGSSDLRLPSSDPDFRSFPGNFDRKLSETDVQLRVKDVERMAIDSGNFLAKVDCGADVQPRSKHRRDFDLNLG
jgi:hypothetical protein